MPNLMQCSARVFESTSWNKYCKYQIIWIRQCWPFCGLTHDIQNMVMALKLNLIVYKSNVRNFFAVLEFLDIQLAQKSLE